jgi:hypothetical protein
MASFDDELDTFMRQSMSGRRPDTGFDALLANASFETMASAAADAAITSAWPDDGGDDDAMPNEQPDAPDNGDDAMLNEQPDSPDDDELLGDGDDDPVEREIQEELLRELPSAKKPLRSAMRQRPADDDDLDVVDKRTDGEDDADENDGDKEADEDEDDLTLPSDGEPDEPVLVVRKPLLPEFRPDFSSSEDSQLSLDGAFEDDDDEDDWLSARDYEPEDADGAAAAAVKKKSKKSKAAAVAAGGSGKRKRAVSAAADGDGAAGNEQKVMRKALMEHKSRQSKMSADEQQTIMQAYIKVAAVDHFMQAEHKEGGGDADSYKSFRALVLEEATMSAAADDDVKALAHAVLDVEADITDTIATTKRAEPDAMQLLLDFVAGATALTFAKETVPAAASRCDVTLQPSSPADLVLATVTLAGGKVRHLALRASLQHLAQNLWTLANFYTIVAAKVAKALSAHKRLSTADALAALEADAEFTKRLVKLLGEAHSKTCWHVRMKLGSK